MWRAVQRSSGQERAKQTDRPTDGQTDRQTDIVSSNPLNMQIKHGRLHYRSVT